MKITTSDRKAFYRAIPVYPKELGKLEIAAKARISSPACSVLAHSIPMLAPICESDTGKLSYISQEEKDRTIHNLLQQIFYEERRKKTKEGEQANA